MRIWHLNRPTCRFVREAREKGVFNLESGYVVAAPTATGKSKLARDLTKEFLKTKTPLELAIYLVPYKALAEEVIAKFRQELPPTVAMQIKTSDYDTQFQISETDLLVSTYESADALLSAHENELWPTFVVADELSIMGAGTRGVRIEGLLTHLATLSDLKIFGLSAVFKDPAKVRDWLGQENPVVVLQGNESLRTAPLHRIPQIFSDGKENAVVTSLVRKSYAENKGSIIVFCGTVRTTEKVAGVLSSVVEKLLTDEEKKKAEAFANSIKSEFPYLYRIDLLEQLSRGVGYHHASIEPDLRSRISDGFLKGIIKVLCASPTLSAGVNLPARTVILRDIRRYDQTIGRPELIPLSEAQNMLGRAGRPGFHEEGTGYFLMPAGYRKDKVLRDYAENVRAGKVEELTGQISKNSTNLMTYLLSTLARSKGLTRKQLMDSLKSSFWAKSENLRLPDSIPTRKELSKLVTILNCPDGKKVFIDGRSFRYDQDKGAVTAQGGSGEELHLITISHDGFDCSHPFYRKGTICKHHKQLAFEIVEGKLKGKSSEASALIFQHLDELIEAEPAGRIANAVEALMQYGFVNEEKQVLVATPDGRQALVNYLLTMPHVRKLRDSVRKMNGCTTEQIIDWCLDDLCPEMNKKPKITRFLKNKELFYNYLEGSPIAEAYKDNPNLIMPFRESRDRMIQIFNAYASFCPKEDLKLLSNIRTAKRRVSYGSPAHLLPLLILNVERIEKPDVAQKLFDARACSIWDLEKIPKESLQTILMVDMTKAVEVSEAAKSKAALIRDFSPEKGLGRLSQQTGIAVEDLLDYFPNIASNATAVIASRT